MEGGGLREGEVPCVVPMALLNSNPFVFVLMECLFRWPCVLSMCQLPGQILYFMHEQYLFVLMKCVCGSAVSYKVDHAPIECFNGIGTCIVCIVLSIEK